MTEVEPLFAPPFIANPSSIPGPGVALFQHRFGLTSAWRRVIAACQRPFTRLLGVPICQSPAPKADSRSFFTTHSRFRRVRFHALVVTADFYG